MRLSPIAVLALPLLACGEERPSFAAPKLGTRYVVYGAAGGGRALGPLDVRVVLATSVDTLEVPGSGAADVDMFFAGIDEAALPAGVDPSALRFVDRSADGARGLPPLAAPHVLRAPSPAGTANALVPVGADPGLLARLERLTARLGIEDPCEPAPFDVLFQRSQGSVIGALRALPSGAVVAGLSVTSTAMIGVIAPNRTELAEVGVSLGAVPAEPGEVIDVVALSAEETSPGRPAELALIRGGLVGHLAVYSSTAARYVDHTPRTGNVVPGDITGLFRVGDRTCVTGGVLGMRALGVGGLWCRAPGGPWEALAAIERAVRITAVRELDRLYALDLAGALYARGGDGRFTEVARAAVNQNCFPICVGLPTVAPRPGGFGAFGDKAAAFAVDLAGGEPSVRAIDSVQAALFADERGGEAPARFISAAGSPDGALWLGLPKEHRFILRVSQDLGTTSRICLPPDTTGTAITAIDAAPDGRLILGGSPPRIAVGAWKRP